MGRRPRLKHRLPRGGGHAGGVLGAEVVEHDDAAGQQDVARGDDVALHVLVQVRGVDVDEAAGVVVHLAGHDRGRALEDVGQLVVERQVVLLEGGAGEGGVRLRRLRRVVLVRRVLRVEEVADREALTVPQVGGGEDGALAHVGAHLQEVAALPEALLAPQEKVEQHLVKAGEPPLDVIEAAGTLRCFGGGGRHGALCSSEAVGRDVNRGPRWQRQATPGRHGCVFYVTGTPGDRSDTGGQRPEGVRNEVLRTDDGAARTRARRPVSA